MGWEQRRLRAKEEEVTTHRTSFAHIERVPGVVGGDAVVKGTRVPVWAIVTYWRTYGTLDDVSEAYPRVTREAAEDALAYYQANPAEIDQGIEENENIANSPHVDNG